MRKNIYQLLGFLFCFLSVTSWGQTPFVMSSGNYTQDFANIANATNWGTSFAGAGTDDDPYKIVTAITGKTVQATVFQTGYTSGGIYRGGLGVAPNNIPAGTIGMGVTGTANGGNVAAFDLYLDFTSRQAGALSVDWQKCQNGVTGTSFRPATFKLQYSIDNGSNFSDIPSSTVVVTNNATPESGTLNISSLPSGLSGVSTVVIRFYFENLNSTGSNNRPRIALDNLSVTSVGAPQINLKQGATTIANGSGIYDFGTVTGGSSSSAVTFTIQNTGSANLNLTGTPIVVISGTNAAEFSVDQALTTSPVTAGGNTTFTITFSPNLTAESKTATITIANDANTNYTFTINGTSSAAPVPEINLKQNVTNIISGTGSFDFGSLASGNSSSAITFTIENLGNAPLNLTGSPIVGISGTNAGEFSVNQVPTTTPVAASSNTTFTITFSPTSAGSKTATITISNDDADESSYTFTITGTATPANDLCTNAADLTLDASATLGTLTNATFTSPFTQNDVWYKFTPAVTGSYKFVVTGFTGNINIEVSLNGGSCPSTTAFLANSISTTATTESISLSLAGGSTYYLRVLSFDGTISNFTAQVQTLIDYVSLVTPGTAYTESFDGMGSSAIASLPTGFKVNGNGAASNFATGTLATTVAAGTSGTGALTGTSGGGVFNFTDGVTATSTDRSLGFLTTGSFISPNTVILRLTNNTGVTITAFNIGFNYEKYRAGTRAFAWTFFHGNTTNPANSAPDGDQAYGADGANAVVNPSTSISKSFLLTGLSIANGTDYYLKWTFTGVGGSSNGQGIGIDKFSITPNPCINVGLTSATPTASTICTGATTTLTYSGLTGTGASVTWYDGPGGTGGTHGTGTPSSPVGPGTYYAYATGTCGSPVEIQVIVGSTNTNSYSTTGNWSNAANWSCGIVPSPTHDIVIANGGHVTLDIPTFTVAGTLNLAATSSFTVGPTSILSVTGTAHFANQSVVFKSTAAGTASLGNSPGLIDGDDNVTVERYIPGQGTRAWRMLTIPLTGDQTIRQAWAAGTAPITDLSQLGAQPSNNGTLITGYPLGTAEAATAVGMDWWPAIANTTSSIRRFHPAGANWTYVVTDNNIPGKTLTQARTDQAYALFVRGDRQQATGTPTSATTLRATGTLIKGATSLPVITAFTAFGNPYASNIDFESIYNNNPGKLQHQFRRWDANNGANGGYITVKYLGGNYLTVPPDDAATDLSHIQSGQGVLLEPATGGIVNIAEGDKVVSTSLPQVFDAPLGLGLFRANLHLDDGGSLKQVDGVLAAVSSSYTTGIDADDVTKVNNFNENIAITGSNGLYTIAALPLISNNDVIALNIGNLVTRKYALQFKAQQMQDGINAYLKDNFLEKETPISTATNEVTTYRFDATADAASKAADRFSIVFKTGALPLSLTSARAYQAGTGVQVEWKAVNERNLRSYEVEKSIDGRSFAKATTVEAQNTAAASYNWLDAAPVKGNNFYRVKATSTDGSVNYSQVLLVNLGSGRSNFTLYPNPSKGRSLSVQFSNMEKGQYSLNVFNSAGQKVMSRSIIHQGGSSSEAISLGAAMASGVYRVSLVNNSGSSQNQVLVLQ